MKRKKSQLDQREATRSMARRKFTFIRTDDGGDSGTAEKEGLECNRVRNSDPSRVFI